MWPVPAMRTACPCRAGLRPALCPAHIFAPLPACRRGLADGTGRSCPTGAAGANRDEDILQLGGDHSVAMGA